VDNGVNLFVYGTLMDDVVVSQLTGRSFPRYAARLAGYRKHTPVGSYPYVVPDDDGEVEGSVLCEVDEGALRAFDEYEDEGRLYRRVEVMITASGFSQPAFVYVAVR
jgi:gamma-glutamylcyclotransferase (GGCT)/AIG2-like uncharacterized protein YtfP